MLATIALYFQQLPVSEALMMASAAGKAAGCRPGLPAHVPLHASIGSPGHAGAHSHQQLLPYQQHGGGRRWGAGGWATGLASRCLGTLGRLGCVARASASVRGGGVDAAASPGVGDGRGSTHHEATADRARGGAALLLPAHSYMSPGGALPAHSYMSPGGRAPWASGMVVGRGHTLSQGHPHATVARPAASGMGPQSTDPIGHRGGRDSVEPPPGQQLARLALGQPLVTARDSSASGFGVTAASRTPPGGASSQVDELLGEGAGEGEEGLWDEEGVVLPEALLAMAPPLAAADRALVGQPVLVAGALGAAPGLGPNEQGLNGQGRQRASGARVQLRGFWRLLLQVRAPPGGGGSGARPVGSRLPWALRRQ
jgi:hypothetical protein